MTRWRDQRFWRLPGLSGLVAFMAKRYMRCSLWINYKWRLHTVIFVASPAEGKHHRTNDEPQNRIKWSWIEPRLQRKSTNQPKFTWWNLFLYLFLYFYVFTTILFFHTIVICLWCDLTSPTSGFAMWLAGRLTQKSVAVEVEKSFQNCSALALRILLPLSHSSLSGKTTVWLLHMNWSISIF